MNRLAILIVLVLAGVLCMAQGDSDVPAYHSQPPRAGEKLPPILPKDALWGESFQQPYQVHAYELAAKIPGVLYQLPCYCYCDRGMGHKSLRSCFEGTHGAHCATCMKELFYAYQQTKLKKTTPQVREGILKGEWRNIDLDQAVSMN